MKLAYQIFTPQKEKFLITPNLIVYTFWLLNILTFITLYVLGVKINVIILISSFITAMITPIYFGILAYFKYEKLNGILTNSLLINSTTITVQELIYNINDIVKVDLVFKDYYGMMDHYNRRGNYNPRISQGVGNYIKFTDKSNQIHHICFKLNHKYEHTELFPFIIEMIKKNKIPFLRGIELLGINDYDKIQEFKEQLKIETQS